jgi:hypothetical protein
MIETIYKGEQKKAEGNEGFFKIPNNIRQVGEVRGHQKIYIEDYAYTFLKKISRSQNEGKLAILFGERNWSEGCAYLFIRSALQIHDLEVTQEHIAFTEKVWSQVYEESRKYFPGQDIMGWFVCFPGFNMQMNEVLLKAHLNYFAGNDKILFAMEPGEWEEAFFYFENDQLNRQPGYYIYYEKNEMMQAYMIAMSENKSIEETEHVPDRAVLDFRKAINEKKNDKKSDREPSLRGDKSPEKTKQSRIKNVEGDEIKNKKANKVKSREDKLNKDGVRISKANEEKEMEKEKENKKEKIRIRDLNEDASDKKTINKKMSYVNLAAAVCAAAVILAVGITFFNSYQNMRGTLSNFLSDGESTAAVDGQTNAQTSAAATKEAASTGENTVGSGDETQASESVSAAGNETGTSGSATRGAEGEPQTGGNESQTAETESRTSGSETQTAGSGTQGTGSETQTAGNGTQGAEGGAQTSGNESQTAETESRTSGSETQTAGSETQGAEGESKASEGTAQTSGSTTKTQDYVIQRGDTLTSICRSKYGTIARIDDVCKANGISPQDIIYAGQKLLLPE